ncbi:hypothetical protein GCM10022219_21240 [Microbacterium oryzae]|uniref:DUF7882 domain-containing protein n=1 Tax=Microbacterium oryzae TaxID=743009 RepID=A0A6I6E8W8_9MICO|nr:hypothetical protein [Microbacterium oryzae]QGU27638.1 hypothetical protein D7D94_08125 [Microbacterium oryzae]
MGTLHYGAAATAVHIEDRALAHLKVVIISKLRRGESFSVSWCHAHGRTTLWVHPAIPLRFVFETEEAPALNRAWLEELAQSANALGGITLVKEQVEDDETA